MSVNYGALHQLVTELPFVELRSILQLQFGL